ncbi:peptidoglycan-binding domain-containing protein [Streptacidiphilus sp. PAMC 29251]
MGATPGTEDASPEPPAPAAPAGSQLTPARPGRRSRPVLLALLVLGATAAAVVTLVEVTAPSGGAPARALPAVGASPDAGGALPTAAAATATASGAQPPSGGSVSPRNPVPASAAASAVPAAGARAGSSATATGTASGPLSAPRNQSATPAVLEPGDRGADVADLQRQLFDQGFTYAAVTGVFDQATTRGVTQLQQNRGITGDPAGVYGPHTRAALEAGD